MTWDSDNFYVGPDGRVRRVPEWFRCYRRYLRHVVPTAAVPPARVDGTVDDLIASRNEALS